MTQPRIWVPLVSGGMLASLGIARRSRAGYALAALGGAMLFEGALRWRSRNDHRPGFARGVMVKKAIRVKANPDECYAFWRKLENLAQFMDHIESIQILDEKRSRWKAKTPAGTVAEWEAEITADRENELIGWRSLPGSQVATAGSVRFERATVTGGYGARITVALKYNPPGGALTAAVLSLLGESPGKQLEADLKRFKSLMEKSRQIPASDEWVELASEDSFPASDPPAWTSASL